MLSGILHIFSQVTCKNTSHFKESYYHYLTENEANAQKSEAVCSQNVDIKCQCQVLHSDLSLFSSRATSSTNLKHVSTMVPLFSSDKKKWGAFLFNVNWSALNESQLRIWSNVRVSWVNNENNHKGSSAYANDPEAGVRASWSCSLFCGNTVWEKMLLGG